MKTYWVCPPDSASYDSAPDRQLCTSSPPPRSVTERHSGEQPTELILGLAAAVNASCASNRSSHDRAATDRSVSPVRRPVSPDGHSGSPQEGGGGRPLGGVAALRRQALLLAGAVEPAYLSRPAADSDVQPSLPSPPNAGSRQLALAPLLEAAPDLVQVEQDPPQQIASLPTLLPQAPSTGLLSSASHEPVMPQTHGSSVKAAASAGDCDDSWY